MHKPELSLWITQSKHHVHPFFNIVSWCKISASDSECRTSRTQASVRCGIVAARQNALKPYQAYWKFNELFLCF